MEQPAITALAKGLVPYVREVVTAEVAARLAEIEERPGEKGADGAPGAKGDAGERGEKGDPADLIIVPPELAEEVKKAIHMLHESPPIMARSEAAPRPPSPPRIARVERDETGAFVPIYDDEPQP